MLNRISFPRRCSGVPQLSGYVTTSAHKGVVGGTVRIRLGRLTARRTRPFEQALVLHVAGEVDAETAPALTALLPPGLIANAEPVVVDLSLVTFFGTPGLGLLVRTQLHAQAHGHVMRLVTGPRCVDRPLHAAGLDKQFTRYPTLTSALRTP